MRKGLMLFVGLAVLSGQAFAAADWSNVTVSAIWVSTNEASSANIGLVEFSAAPSGGASCGSGNNKWGAIDLSTIGGQELYRTLLLARTTAATLTAIGVGTCGVISGYETLAQAQM